MTAPPTTGRRGIRLGPVGVVVRRRALAMGAGLIALICVLMVLALTVGTLDYSIPRVLSVLAGNGTRVDELLIVDRRLSRAVAAVLVGFCLGAAGALTQSITRNPIASPDILGVTTGAGFFAVVVVTNPRVFSGLGLPVEQMITLSALVGGMLTTAIILALSWRAGFDGFRLVLVGISVNAIALAGISFLLTRTEVSEAQIAVRWLSGSVFGIGPDEVRVLAPVAVVGLLVCVVLTRDLAALRLGEEIAPSLGTSPGRANAAALLVAVVLTSAATALAGPVGFVAFVAPQAAMRLFRTAGPPPVAGGIFGASLVLAADLLALQLPVDLPVGVITSIIGAPYLLHLLIQHMRRTRA